MPFTMPRKALIPLVLAAALLLAGCAAKSDVPAGEADKNDTPAAVSANESAKASTNASTNATTSPDMPQDPASCMGGMDMPGCTAAQADNYYKKMQAEQAAKGPPPDRALTPLKITLNAQGVGQDATTSIDERTTSLLITIYVNDTGPGPYAAFGPGGQGDMTLVLKGSATTKTVALAGTGSTAGADPGAPLQKTFNAKVSMPEAGAWKATVNGQGQNVVVVINITERFTMDS